MTFDYPNHFVLDDIQTWPSRISRILTKLEPNLQEYREIELQIDDAAEKDVLLRINRPTNKNEKFWNYAVSRISELIKDFLVVGFHCSRLTENEISDVKRNGLTPLMTKFAVTRIKTLTRDGLLSPITAQKLIEENEAGATNRNGNVCFFHCLSTLKDESGLYQLFRAWGGEAIYLNHENNPSVFHEITAVGKPCIILASIYPNEVGFFNDLEERIIKIWLDRNVETESNYDCDSLVKRQVSVLEILNREDPKFEILTGCDNWFREI